MSTADVWQQFRDAHGEGVQLCVEIGQIDDLGELEEQYESCPVGLRTAIVQRYRQLLQCVMDLDRLEARFRSCPKELQGVFLMLAAQSGQ